MLSCVAGGIYTPAYCGNQAICVCLLQMTQLRTIGLTFDSRRLSRERQEQIVRAKGATHIIHVGTSAVKTWRDLPRETVPGDTVIVAALVLMPTPRTTDAVSPTDQPGEILADVQAMGVVLIEALTGRRSDNREDRRRMIVEAARGIRAGHRSLPKGAFYRGRRAADCSAALEQARQIWHSPAYSTNAAAIAHMPPCRDPITGRDVPWTFGMIRERGFGPSGRPFPKRRR